jgi:hypothetical protein
MLIFAKNAAELVWLALLIPFLIGFQSSPMYKRLVFEGKQWSNESASWYLAYLSLSVLALEVCITTLALTETSKTPFLALICCSIIPLFAYFAVDLRDSKAVLVFAQLLACTGPIFIHIMLYPTLLALSLALYPASFVVILRALRRKCHQWSGHKCLQATYLVILIGKIMGILLFLC